MNNMNNIDLLNRKDYVEHIFEILETANNNKEGKSISLYGGWGSGKSFVLNMLDEKLTSNNYLVIKYNAWERDFYDEPLVGMLFAFANYLNDYLKSKNTIEGLKTEIVLECISTCLSVIGGITKQVVGVDIPKALLKAYKKISNARKKKEINTNFNDKINIEKARKEVRDSLKELTSKAKVVFIIDEIDRCLPDYSLKVLERTHHFLHEIPGLQAITAVDSERLNNAIKHFYGDKVDTDRYLQKFFNLNLLLNEGNFNDNFNDRYDDYCSVFSSQLPFIDEKDVHEFIKLLFMNKNMRFVDESVKKAKLIHQILSKKRPIISDFTVMCGELLISYLSLCKDKKNAYHRIFGPQRCNPSRSTYFVQPYKDDDNLNDLNVEIDRAASKLQIAANDVWIMISNLWEFLVYLIINNGHTPSATNYTFGCNISNGAYMGDLTEIYNFLLAFNDQAFIL